MMDSVCTSCANTICVYKGCPATQWEPEEPPEYECTEGSENFMTKDGCCNYMEAVKRDFGDLCDEEYERWRERRYE